MLVPPPPPAPPELDLAHSVLPRRVRKILHEVLQVCTETLARELGLLFDEFEQQAFQNAEQARSNAVQVRWLETLRSIRQSRPKRIPRYLATIEQALARLRTADTADGDPGEASHKPQSLTLMEPAEIEESTTLTEIGSRIEMRHSLPIYLLGQRFGVLAGRPAFDAEHLPLGPQALCRYLRQTVADPEIPTEHRVLIYRLFERRMLNDYGRLLDALNQQLIREGVLPGLHYMPFRSPGSSNPRGTEPQPASTDPQKPRKPAAGQNPTAVQAPDLDKGEPAHSRTPLPWLLPGESTTYPAPAAHSGSPLPGFEQIRDLLSSRRSTLGKLSGSAAREEQPGAPIHCPAPRELQHALSLLQPNTATSVNMGGRIVPRTVTHLKQDLLNQIRRSTPPGETPMLAEEDNDTFDLVGMLFDELVKDVRPNSPASNLLTKLQVPLLRVAIADKRFFNDSQHPARQMLNAVAETGSYWLGEDDADAALISRMQALVDRTLQDFDGDMSLFESLLKDLSAHLQTIARKAEVAERRHIEAARGKERLAQARERASESIKALTEGSDLPVFTRTLLHQAWTDVMALTALRQGEESEAWTKQLGTARQLVALSRPEAKDLGDDDAVLQKEVGEALRQVGYHETESEAIAKRLVAPASESTPEDAASRTELLMRVKSANRLGSSDRPSRPQPELLTPEVQARVAQIKTLAFGSWFEFTINSQGDRSRRRLSWYSPMSGTAMFVNHRGQKVAETTIEHLAIQMTNGQARLVEEQRESLIDRAWNAVLRTLSSFASGAPREAKA